MDVLKDNAIEVHRSDECGHIIFTSTGKGLKVNCKKGTYNSGESSKDNKTENTVKTETNISSYQDNSEDTLENKDLNESTAVTEHNFNKVYWTKSGKKYHSTPDCSGMNSPISGTVEDSHRTPCSKCY